MAEFDPQTHSSITNYTRLRKALSCVVLISMCNALASCSSTCPSKTIELTHFLIYCTSHILNCVHACVCVFGGICTRGQVPAEARGLINLELDLMWLLELMSSGELYWLSMVEASRKPLDCISLSSPVFQRLDSFSHVYHSGLWQIPSIQ